MSISAWCSRDSVEIRRESVSEGSEGAVKEWTTVARGATLPTEMDCRIQDLPSTEASAYGVLAELRAFKLYFSSNPYLDTRDHVIVTDTDGVARECFVLYPSFSFDGPHARLWKAIVVDYVPTE